MEYNKTHESPLQESTGVPKITELLTQLSVRIDSLERSLSTIDEFIKKNSYDDGNNDRYR